MPPTVGNHRLLATPQTVGNPQTIADHTVGNATTVPDASVGLCWPISSTARVSSFNSIYTFIAQRHRPVGDCQQPLRGALHCPLCHMLRRYITGPVKSERLQQTLQLLQLCHNHPMHYLQCRPLFARLFHRLHVAL